MRINKAPIRRVGKYRIARKIARHFEAWPVFNVVRLGFRDGRDLYSVYLDDGTFVDFTMKNGNVDEVIYDGAWAGMEIKSARVYAATPLKSWRKGKEEKL